MYSFFAAGIIIHRLGGHYFWNTLIKALEMAWRFRTSVLDLDLTLAV